MTFQDFWFCPKVTLQYQENHVGDSYHLNTEIAYALIKLIKEIRRSGQQQKSDVPGGVGVCVCVCVGGGHHNLTGV